MLERDSEFLVEAWSLYGVGCTLMLTRFAVRIRTVGFKGFCGDDYFAMGVLLCYTMDAVLVDKVYRHGSNADFTQAQLKAMTKQELDLVVLGSKLEMVAWYSYTALIWFLKGTMIFFFRRLTLGTSIQRGVKWIGIAVALCYIPVFFTITLSCRPVSGNWQAIPAPPVACTAKRPNFIVTVLFNVITDAALLSIPLPMLWKLKIPIHRKIVIGLLLSSGIFVITAAIIRGVFSLVAHPSAVTVNRWGVRETIVGILAVNLPILRPLFRRSFWTGKSKSHPLTDTPPNASRSYGMNRISTKAATSKGQEYDNSSTEHIVDTKGDIRVETTIQINHTTKDLEGGHLPGLENDWEKDGNHATISSGV